MAFSLTQFLGAFEVHDDSGLPYVIIGGQAVNYWAETYLRSEPELAAYLPFVSKDIDFIGGRADVLKVARQLHLTVKFPHKKLMTAFAGAVLFRIGDVQANIEFLRTIPGVSINDVRKWAVASERDGRSIRVVDPISLLACKLDLTLTVDQTNRRDEDHFRILLICARAFLREVLLGAENGELPMRGWLGATERLIKIAESKLGRRAAMELKIQWDQFLPEAEIKASQNSLIVGFREKRLPQWLKKIQRLQKGRRA